MMQLGFSQDLLKYFQSYLQNRPQYVEYNGYQSNIFTSSSGVPQGSVLGPLLFNIFINDIGNELTVNYLLYADDMKLFKRIEEYNDCLELQANIDKLQVWCNNNKLILNVKKCNILTYSIKLHNITFQYSLDNITLTRPLTIRDLGITFDPKLSFNTHVNIISNEASKTLGFIIRNSHDFNDLYIPKLLYQSFVRPKMEYSSIIWHPKYEIHKQTLERVQRRFLKFLSYKADGTYPIYGYPHDELLSRHSLSLLESRRVISQQVFLFNLIHNIVNCTSILASLNFIVPRQNTRQSSVFYLPTPRTNILRFSPLYVMCDNHNKLTNEFDIFHCNVASIKKLAPTNLV